MRRLPRLLLVLSLWAVAALLLAAIPAGAGTPGTQKWVFTLQIWGESYGFAEIFSPALGPDGTVYVGAPNFPPGPNPDSGISGKLYAVNPDGTQKWVFTLDKYSSTSSPALGPDGTVYVGATNGQLYALSPLDGTQKWAFHTGGTIFSCPALGQDGTVYVGASDGKLYAVNPDGTQKWAFTTGGSAIFFPGPGRRRHRLCRRK